MKLDSAFRYLDEHRDRFTDELIQFLRIPSISAHPDHDADVAAALDYDKRKLESLGFRTEVWPTRSHAGLFAERVDVPVERPTTRGDGVRLILGRAEQTLELVVVGRGKVGKRVHCAGHLSWRRTTD